MKNSKLKCTTLILAVAIFYACSNNHKQESNQDTSSTAPKTRIPENHLDITEVEIDHSPSSNTGEVNQCLKKFFNENPPTIKNALTTGAIALRDCKAKPGDIVMFVENNIL